MDGFRHVQPNTAANFWRVAILKYFYYLFGPQITQFFCFLLFVVLDLQPILSHNTNSLIG